MKSLLSLALISVVSVPAIGMCDSKFSGFEVAGGGVDIDEVGEAYAIDVGYNATENVRVRLGYGRLNLQHNRKVGIVNIKERVEQKNVRLNVDWFPWAQRNGVFLSAGLAQLSDPSTLEVTDTSFSPLPLGTVTGSIETRSVAPYVGVGYRYQFKENKGWFLQAELGRILNIDPKLSLESDNPANIPGLNVGLQAVADDQNDQIDDGYTAYGIMLGYRF